MKRMIYCPNRKCPHHKPQKGWQVRFVRNGRFKRRYDGRLIQRFRCRFCRRNFSSATMSPLYRQHKPWLNHPIKNLFCSGVSQRRMALYFKINRKTVVRKLLFMADCAEKVHQEFLIKRQGTIPFIQFDEMETFEHTKCKPLSIPVVVDAKTRHILAFGVASMPCKGTLAKISRKRYGPRKDERPQVIGQTLQAIVPLRTPDFKVLSDKNPHYPGYIQKHLPGSAHQTVKGRRGCVVGQGELKRGGWDPLFKLNHSCAMFRANVNRLFRRTWCTTKKAERLKAHLMLYVDYHNRVLVGY